MATISLRIPDELLSEIDERANKLHMPRAQYIRETLSKANKSYSKEERAQRMKEESLRCREESMKVNREFAEIEYDPEDVMAV